MKNASVVHVSKSSLLCCIVISILFYKKAYILYIIYSIMTK